MDNPMAAPETRSESLAEFEAERRERLADRLSHYNASDVREALEWIGANRLTNRIDELAHELVMEGESDETTRWKHEPLSNNELAAVVSHLRRAKGAR